MTMVLAPPTRSATAPRPSMRAVRPLWVAALAASASEGRETLTPASPPGLIVRARIARTSSTDASVERSKTVVGWPSKPKWRSAEGKPTIATRSRFGTGSSGFRMPTTTTRVSFIMIVSPVRVMPSRSAATAPRTVTGSRSPAGSSQAPLSTSPPSAARRSVRTACVVTPAVRSSGTRSLRRIRASTSPVPVACRTGPMCSTIATAFLGSLTSLPRASLPASAVRRLVPSRSSLAIRSARLDSERPTTATMVAMPMVMPSAAGRLVREQQPGLPRQRAGDGHALLLAAGQLVRRVGAAVVEADPVERGSRPRPAFPQRHARAQQFLSSVWDHTFPGDSRLVDAAVGRLRAKLEDVPARPRYVQTVRGFGYRLGPL